MLGDFQGLIENVTQMALRAIGIAVMVMFLIGGFQYLSAGGDKEATQRASKTLTFAIGGLILALSAWIILKLIGDFVGIDFTNIFQVCLPAYSGPGCI